MLRQLAEQVFAEGFHQHHHPWAFHPDLYSAGIPLLLCFVPWLVVRVFATDSSRTMHYKQCETWLLVGAGLAWALAIQLPNIPVWSSTETTTMHLIGGAIVAPLLYAYGLQAYRVDLPRFWWMRFGALYAFVSAFSVTNEIAEFTFNALHLVKIDGTDTWYDLTTTSLGMLAAFAGSEAYRALRRPAAALKRA